MNPKVDPTMRTSTGGDIVPDEVGEPGGAMTQQNQAVRRGGPRSVKAVEYLPLREAAGIYHISVDTLRRRILDGTLPAVRSGRRIIRVSTADLDRLFRPVQSARSVYGG